MQIKEICAASGRTFNHPHESFSNLRPYLQLRATIDEGEDPEQATKELQAKVEKLVEDHKNAMLQSLNELYEMSALRQEVTSLEQTILRAQDRLEKLRASEVSQITHDA